MRNLLQRFGKLTSVVHAEYNDNMGGWISEYIWAKF